MIEHRRALDARLQQTVMSMHVSKRVSDAFAIRGVSHSTFDPSAALSMVI